MKKTVIIILAILPIFLLITIAFAGRILSLYQHISVEKVIFVDETEEEFQQNFIFTVEVGEEKATYIKIYPELASDKSVTYTSENTDVCTVDENGVISGLKYGTSTVIVKTTDSGKISMLNVKVTQDKVSGVTLSESQLSLNVGESKNLTAEVQPFSAINKKITFSSNNTSVVTVSANGKVTAISQGEATITVTTQDGGFTASCTVTVTEGAPPLYFDFTSIEEITQSGAGYISTIAEINLLDYIVFDEEKMAKDDINLRISSGSSYATISQGVLTFNQKNRVITITAYVGDSQNPTYKAELRLMLQ